ncbi:MAG: DUF5361 domain-containing protein [Clostridia bacterium]|nr:DUF5361 domain-containing protein [Clostridia bacterium]
MKISEEKITLTETLLALIVDRLSLLVWQNTKDGHKGTNRPQSIVDILTKEREECEGFESGDDFMEKWRSL